MSGEVILGGQSVNTGTATVTQGVATVSSTGLAGYDGSDLPVLVPADANNPARKVSPDGVTTVPPNIGQVPLVASSASEVRPLTPSRQILNVRNIDPMLSIYVGIDDTVSGTTGYLLLPYEALDIRSTTAIWAIAASGTPRCAYLEEVSS